VQFLTGALATHEPFNIYTQSNTLKQTVVTGDASATAAGDTGWAWFVMHADAFQYDTQGAVVSNILVQRYKTVALTQQPIMFQSYAAGNAKDIGFQLCIFDMYGSGAYQRSATPSSNIVMRQCTHLGAVFNFRGQSQFQRRGLCDSGLLLRQYGIYRTFPATGVTIANNHFQGGTARGTNGTGPGDPNLDASYRPLPGSPLLNRCSPVIPFDYSGDALPPAGAAIGAVGG
jgi:hypothetical protein